MQNPFTNIVFSITTLTSAINTLPINYGRVENLNLFPSRSVRFRHITIEEHNGVLSLLPTQVPGAPATVRKRGKRKVRTFTIPHIPHNVTELFYFVDDYCKIIDKNFQVDYYRIVKKLQECQK